MTNKLSKITPTGVRTEIFTFVGGTNPWGLAIDSAGNYIVTEQGTSVLSKVTPAGVRTPIFTFPATTLGGVAIDSAGNYIVTGGNAEQLFKITPGGVMTIIFTFAANTDPVGIAIFQPLARPVGGVVEPVNKLALATPFLALAGLVAVVSAVIVVKRRRD
jgi:DNA-binding beta-propeller fold protein YncE